MWKIIEAEFHYHLTALAITFAIGMLIVIFLIFSIEMTGEGSRTAWALMSTTMTLYGYLLIHIGGHQDQEKRDRMNATLPISIKHLGIARWALVIFLQIGFAVLTLCGVMMASKFELKSLFAVLSSNAFLFLIVGIIAMYQELGHFCTRIYRRIFWGLLFSFLVLIGLFVLSGQLLTVARNIFEPYTTPEGAAIYSLLAIGLLILNVIIFTRRRSYLS